MSSLVNRHLIVFFLLFGVFGLIVGCSSDSGSSSDTTTEATGASVSDAISLTQDTEHSSSVGAGTSLYFTFVPSSTGDYLFSANSVSPSTANLDIYSLFR